MAFMAVYPNSQTHRITKFYNNFKPFFSAPSPSPPPSLLSTNVYSIRGKASTLTHSIARDDVVTSQDEGPSSTPLTKHKNSPFTGLEDVMTGYMFGTKKATEVAHAVWKNVVEKGDLVIDATCGNGYDTLALLRLIADDTRRGRVYAMDLQKDALENTSSLLDRSVTADERELVELYAMCHTKMEEIVPSGTSVRLVAFNLGFLPRGDKKIKTLPETTVLALEAAKRIVAPRGLISIVAYPGHTGGREEFEKVRSFARGLPVDDWICCKLRTINRPLAPILFLLSKK